MEGHEQIYQTITFHLKPLAEAKWLHFVKHTEGFEISPRCCPNTLNRTHGWCIHQLQLTPGQTVAWADCEESTLTAETLQWVN